MSHKITGTVHKIFDTIESSSGFRSREFVLSVPDGNYTQFIKFRVVKDRCDILDHFAGLQVEVTFNIRGREWNEKYFNDLEAWGIQAVGIPKQEQSQPAATPPPTAPASSDGVPF